MKAVLKYCGILLVIQIVVWLLVAGIPPYVQSPLPDAVFTAVVILYFPTVWLVERFGHFTGEAKIIEPIFLGVPLGIALYSVMFALIVAKLRSSKRNI